MCFPLGKYRLASRIKNAPKVINAQQTNRNKDDCQNPVAAFATGRASIPPPIEVPTIKRIPPINLECINKPYFTKTA
jgi:hypothetical protein